MRMRLELEVPAVEDKIALGDKVLLVGSCFTSNIGEMMSALGLNCVINPGGIVFNPFSIASLFKRALNARPITSQELFEHNELFSHWQFHGSFSHAVKDEALQRMNAALAQTASAIIESRHVILTLGSAFTYSVKQDWPGAKAGEIVANCHKVPANVFNHNLPPFQDVKEAVAELVQLIHEVNAKAQIIFTVSPVRHYREGLIENNRSKGLLLNAVAAALKRGVNYFPAYELVLDDLRDYRFYADDLVHPNYAATNYVWKKFFDSYFSAASKDVLDKVAEINRAFKHRPLHPDTQQHKNFLQKYYELTLEVSERYPALNLQNQLSYFVASVGK